MNGKKRVLLMGNANVGKSTVFNEITGSHQHTGNWIGKTVDMAQGKYYYKFTDYEIIDLPGTYSLLSSSSEEKIARDYLCFGDYDCVVCVVDACCLQRNLNLVFQVLEVTGRVVVLLNLVDEAKKKNIFVDDSLLSSILNVPVVKATARSGKGINELLEQVHLVCNSRKENVPYNVEYSGAVEYAAFQVQQGIEHAIKTDKSSRFFALRILENDDSFNDSFKEKFGEDILNTPPLYGKMLSATQSLKDFQVSESDFSRIVTESLIKAGEDIKSQAVKKLPSKKEKRDKRLDNLLLGKYTSIPVMIVILGIVLWLTIAGSNYPSQILQSFFEGIEIWLAEALAGLGVSETVISITVYGVLKVLFWVVAVMLPPMAIFFPLFSLLEEFGILPRIAFNLDGAFEKCGACGKQALTTCMGYGCNAVGVTGCRIIDSPRERLVAIITNSLTPCNGRFPLLIAVISMFFCKNSILSTLILLSLLAFSMVMTFVNSKVLSKTVLKGQSSFFTLELPPYRKPQFFKIISETVREKIIFVLLRAMVVAAPAGLVIWLFANIIVGDKSILCHIADFLQPFGSFIGMDGVMVLAFVLGFPANEIVIPIALMAYMSTGVMSDYSSLDSLKEILVSNGWTEKTAICTCIFSMFHFPCSTTLLTIIKETKSIKWSLLSVLSPLVTGIIICSLINLIF